MLTFRAPAYVGVGGLSGAVVSAFLQAATRSLAASPLCAAPGGLCLAAPGQQVSSSELLGLALHGLDGRPPSNLPLHSVGLGASLRFISFALVVIVGGCGGRAPPPAPWRIWLRYS